MPDARPLTEHQIDLERKRPDAMTARWLATVDDAVRRRDYFRAVADTQMGLCEEVERALAAKSEECERLTRELEQERKADAEVQEIIGRYMADVERLTSELASANASCRRAEAQIEAIDAILERADPTLLDHETTPECVEAMAQRLGEARNALGVESRDKAALGIQLAEAQAALRKILNLTVPMGSDYGHGEVAQITAAALAAGEKGEG